MSMSKNQVGDPFVYVRKRRTQRTQLVANVLPSSAPQQDFSSKEICQKSSNTLYTEPNKLFESKRPTTKCLEFGKDLGDIAQKFAYNNEVYGLMKSSGSNYNAVRKGKEVYEENNNTMSFADICAQRGNKGITICERSVNPRNDHFSGRKLQFQESPNYFLSNKIREMRSWPRHHKPRITVHPTKIIGPSRFSQNYGQNMQRTSVRVPFNFSVLKLIMGDDTLTDEELLYAQELLSTQELPSEGQRVQQRPCNQVANHQGVQTLNSSYMKLLMEDEDSSILTQELYEKQLLSTQCSFATEGHRAQVQQINLPSNQYQPQETSYMDLLRRDDMSYMDLLTRDDISGVDLLTREDISYTDLLTSKDISWTLDA
ncbi:putative protein isoform X1 [Capsicum chacoense]